MGCIPLLYRGNETGVCEELSAKSFRSKEARKQETNADGENSTRGCMNTCQQREWRSYDERPGRCRMITRERYYIDYPGYFGRKREGGKK